MRIIDLKIGKKVLMFFILVLYQLIALFIVCCRNLSYEAMSIISIAQLAINTVMLRGLLALPIFSVPNMFAFFSLIFHCGQLIKKGLNIKGTVPLPFENYANSEVIHKAFAFYLFAQLAIMIGVGLSLSKRSNSIAFRNTWQNIIKIDGTVYGKALLIIGCLPRIYIDTQTLVGAMNGGYEGVYSIYIPQAVQSLAFFFDAGLIIWLCTTKKRRRQRLVFFLVILYKCIMMSTGARQEKVAFLVIWIYVYCFVISKINFTKIVLLGVATAGGFVFISAISLIRGSGSMGFQQTVAFLQSGTMTNIIGSALGEFGAAFNTLEVAVRYVPKHIAYGYGKSYIAGCISVIPLIVNQIPSLADAVVFLNQLPKRITFAFGGSYLGELYYNFSWVGLIGCIYCGLVLGKLHTGISNNQKEVNIYQSWCAIVSTAMVLFVRGYFTDMVQKLVWTYFFIYLLSLYFRWREKRTQSEGKS